MPAIRKLTLPHSSTKNDQCFLMVLASEVANIFCKLNRMYIYTYSKLGTTESPGDHPSGFVHYVKERQ